MVVVDGVVVVVGGVELGVVEVVASVVGDVVGGAWLEVGTTGGVELGAKLPALEDMTGVERKKKEEEERGEKEEET